MEQYVSCGLQLGPPPPPPPPPVPEPPHCAAQAPFVAVETHCTMLAKAGFELHEASACCTQPAHVVSAAHASAWLQQAAFRHTSQGSLGVSGNTGLPHHWDEPPPLPPALVPPLPPPAPPPPAPAPASLPPPPLLLEHAKRPETTSKGNAREIMTAQAS
jgi:hypothetical protein